MKFRFLDILHTMITSDENSFIADRRYRSYNYNKALFFIKSKHFKSSRIIYFDGINKEKN